MRFFKRLSLVLGVIIFGFVAWSAYYAYDKGFTKKWRRFVHDEFRKRGIEAVIGKLTFDPFEGFVARDVEFYQDAKRKHLLAEISRVSLDVDLLKVVREEFFLNTIDVRDAHVSLPIDPADPKSRRIDIKDFNARLMMSDNRIQVTQAYGNLHGIHVNLRGSLFKPTAATSDDGKESDGKSRPGDDNATAANQERTLELIRRERGLIDAVVTELEALDYPPGTPPVLSIEINGDLDDIENLQASFHLTASSLSRANYALRELDALIELRESVVTLKHLLVTDDSGELRAQGQYRVGDPSFRFQVQSSLDLHQVANTFFNEPLLREVVFYEPPQIFVEGDYFLTREPEEKGPPVKIVGSFQSNTVASRGGVIFQGFEVDFGIDRDQYYLRNVKLSHETGTLTGTALYRPDGIQYEGVMKLNPKVFAPFVRSPSRKFLEKCGVLENSTLYFEFRGNGPDLDFRNWHTLGEIDARDFTFNGVPIVRAQMNVEFDGRDHVYNAVQIQREEGVIVAEHVLYNLDTRISVLENVEGNVWPVQILRCIKDEAAAHLEPYRFSSPPTYQIWGVIDPKQRIETDYQVKFNSEGPTDYDFLGATLPFENVEGYLHFKGDSLAQSRIDGGLLGGDASVQLAINNLSTTKEYSARLDVKSISFKPLSLRYSDYESTEGELTGYFDLTGRGDDAASVSGQGKAIILDGNVFAIPFLGPLSTLISDLVRDKKAGHSVAREASASFLVKNGVISTDDFEALTNAFKLTGGGSIDYLNNRVDFSARMNAKGAAGLLFFPVSKLLEYECDGTMSDPDWRPKNIPNPGRIIEKAVDAATGK